MRHQYGTSLISGDGVVGADTDDIRWLTYAEIGRARGISTASANRLAFRRKWRRQTGNDGIARVAVPRQRFSHVLIKAMMPGMTIGMMTGMISPMLSGR